MRKPGLKLRRALLAFIFAGALGLIAGSAAVTSYAVTATAKPHAAAPADPLARVTRVPATPLRMTAARQVPVLVYHEMDNDCAAAAPVCRSHDYESVSLAQFRAEMAWMYARGYHTVTLGQYLAWLADPRTLLPPHPFLITVDNGIADFLEGAQPVLYHYRYTATAFLVTGFADAAAAGKCPAVIRGVDVAPGCPGNSDHGWDATWSQLKALSPAVWSFGMEAGPSGHFQQDYAKDCYAFAACKLPGETTTAYEHRVLAEFDHGIAELTWKLGPRFDSRAWVVPYSDLGYPCRAGCAYEHSTGPHGWLVSFAAVNFRAVFVQDAYRNGISHERFRFEIHGLTTQRDFEAGIRQYLAAGAWKAS